LSTRAFQPAAGNLWAPPLPFRRQPPQSNCPPETVPEPGSRFVVRTSALGGWYSTGDSTEADAPASPSPTYPIHPVPKPNLRLQLISTGFFRLAAGKAQHQEFFNFYESTIVLSART